MPVRDLLSFQHSEELHVGFSICGDHVGGRYHMFELFRQLQFGFVDGLGAELVYVFVRSLVACPSLGGETLIGASAVLAILAELLRIVVVMQCLASIGDGVQCEVC